MKVLITGAAGFIGYHVASRLLSRGDEIIGFDNVNDYYDPELKKARLGRLSTSSAFVDVRGDIADREAVARLFKSSKPQRVIHLAAQAGVRYSIENPDAYIDSNLVGFGNVLEACRHNDVAHLVYASSSSVYGSNKQLPFSVRHNVDHPLSLYAATKKANELMAHVYSHLFGLPTTGLRFFTVYGPWGRPDMALFMFTKNILAGVPIDVYNNGRHSRSFTYIDDVVEGVIRVLDRVPAAHAGKPEMSPDPSRSSAPYRVYNIGSSSGTELLRYIALIEEYTEKKATLNLLPLQPGDVVDTRADVEELMCDVGYSPSTPVETGIRNFVSWYRSYYNV